MDYPIAIEPGDSTTAWGVVVPDLPGCFSAGDTLDEAYANAKEAIAAWIEAALENGDSIPSPKSVAEHVNGKDFEGWTWAVVSIAANPSA
jgi:predicted RNase H-like HicB family nuclease